LAPMVLDSAELKILESVVEKLKEDPSIVYEPDLVFLKDFLLSWGATVPNSKATPKAEESTSKPASGPQRIDPEPKPEPAEEEEEEDEDPEEPEEEEGDDPDRLPEDTDPFPAKAPVGEVELTDEQMDKQGELKQAAIEALEMET